MSLDPIRSLLQRVLPAQIYHILVAEKYLHFFATGVSGVGINLIVTWVLTRFFFGLEDYFLAYVIGTVCNLVFNFIMHFRMTFRTEGHVLERLVGFVAYSFSMTLFQAWVVKTVTPILGLEHYLVVIAGVILLFSIVTFLLFKYFLFRTVPEGEIPRFPQLLLIAMFSSAVLHLTGFFEVLHGKGLSMFVSGDAIRYVELARNLLLGNGFSFMGSDGVVVMETFRTPGLPLLLAPFLAIPKGIMVYLIAQTILAATLIPYLVYRIGTQVFSARAGMIAAWLIALEPQMMFASWSPITEIPFLLCVLLATALLLSLRSVVCVFCRNVRIGVAGLLLGYAVLIRPGNYSLIMLSLVLPLLYFVWQKKKKEVIVFVLVLVSLSCVVVPWQLRNQSLTGVFALSAAGWRNVYVDYVASVLALENGTPYHIERAKRKEGAVTEFGLETKYLIDSPTLSGQLRDSALRELVGRPLIVFKLESLLLLSYFTNDNYYNQMIRFGFVPEVLERGSPSQILLREGLSGVPHIWEEMRKQYFVPIISRLYQFALIGFALIGLFRSPRPLGAFFAVLIGLSALMATVLGFGLEARLRMPVMPILFLLVGHAIATGLPVPRFLRRMGNHETRDLHSGVQ